MRVAVLVADFYKDISAGLQEQALKVLHRAAVETELFHVNGALELPLLLRMVMAKGYDGYVVLGCVIRGETEHYRHVCACCYDGLMRLASQQALPVGFGVLTVETKRQAEARLNYGSRAAESCLKLMTLKRTIDVG